MKRHMHKKLALGLHGKKKAVVRALANNEFIPEEQAGDSAFRFPDARMLHDECGPMEDATDDFSIKSERRF